MKMWVIHKRMAELWMKQRKQGGTLDEVDQAEMNYCLEANMRKVLKLAELENKSLIASMINDTDWQHEICAEIDKLQSKMS
jgi:hypothetical protein